ncbi:MAG: Metallo-beta-lactamase superfamily protein [Methanoregula sp. PtaU1.Bin051]|nr:MAG: Metallo-beta-lactamase superfamily protein [Methanoregula sp. PtaU1.Bin051]
MNNTSIQDGCILRKYSFITRMPDEAGALHLAAAIIRKYNGNINRLQFDRRIDPATVFFEVTTEETSYDAITRELAAIGYLQTSIQPISFLKFYIDVPNRSGALDEFLRYTTEAGANIAFIDFDDAGRHPGRLTVSLHVGPGAGTLMEQIKSKYRMEILEYDNTGEHLDDTVFYVKLAQKIRNIIGDSEDDFLLSFLADTNHIAQELMDRGNDPKKAFSCVLETGQTIRATTGSRFYSDAQRIPITGRHTLFCFQMPCGGSVFAIKTPDEAVLVDTGYGIYHEDVLIMLEKYGIGKPSDISRIFITHADADHCGAAGFFSAPSYMHHTTLGIIKENNRAYGSRSDKLILETFYTKMINLFSGFTPPENVIFFNKEPIGMRGEFPVIGMFEVDGIRFEILEGLGGHIGGQAYLFSADEGLLFAADSIINVPSLTPARMKYNSLAEFLVASVNVNNDLAKKERRALLNLVEETDNMLKEKGKQCLVCGGHGAVSVYEGGKLVAYGDVEHYGAVALP